MPWGAAIAAAAAVGSAYMGSEASKDAAGQQTKSAQQAMQAAGQASALTQNNLYPFTSAGVSSLQQLMYLTGQAPKPGSGFMPDEKTAMLRGNKAFKTVNDGTSDGYLGRYGIDPNAMTLDQIAPTWGVDRVVDANGNVVWGKQYPTSSSTTGGASNDPNFGSLVKPFAPSDLTTDPSYQFRLDQGTTALTRAMSSRGLTSSTPGLRSLMNFNQGLASTEYQAAFSRDLATKQNTWSMLASLAGMGQNSAAGVGTTALNASGQIGAAAMAGGNAAAAGTLGSASAINNSIQGGLANYMYQQRYNQTMGMYQSLLTQNQPTGTATTPGGAGAGLDV